MRSLIKELRRRSVFKVGIAYLIAAWLLVQIADTAMPALRLPDWTVTFVWVVLIIGFPVALLLAWAYELTPHGLRHALKPADEHLKDGAAIGPPDATAATASISVLPFTSLIASGEYTYLADAMTLELQSLLSRLRDVRVVSRQSSLAHSTAGSGLRKIAQDLGVQYVISGSVAMRNDGLRVTVELDDALDDHVLWSEQYDIDAADIWNTQRSIAEAVVGTFGGERLRAEIRRAAGAAGHDDSVRLLVQKARAYLLDYSADALAGAKTLLAKAVEIDDESAEAHAVLGLVTAEATLNAATDDPGSARRKALETVKRAAALAPMDPIVICAAGCVHAYAGDYQESLNLLRRATKLAPFDPGAWGYLGWPLVATGRAEHLDELHKIVARLLERAPHHPGRAYWLFHESVALTCEQRFDEAVQVAQQVVAEQPGFAMGRMHYANVLGGGGRTDRARQAALESVEVNPKLTARYYADLMAVLSDQPAVIESRTNGLRRAGLLGD